MRRLRRIGALASAGGLVLAVALPPAIAGASSGSLVSEQLVVSHLDPSGLPLTSELVTKVTAVDRTYGKVLVPTSTINLRYLDKRGAPNIEGDNAAILIGGDGSNTVLLGSDFGKPLPVALHAEYEQGGVARDPETLGGEGQFTVRYTVTNTVVKTEKITYKNAKGVETTTKAPVFAPFAGTLVVTLPPGAEVVSAAGAVASAGKDGESVLTWNLVLYPPLGSYEQKVTLVVNSPQIAVPAMRMNILPVTSAEDAAVGFSRDLLDASVKGNAELAKGLTELDDSAVALAGGATAVSDGLAQISSGAEQLSQAATDQQVPGAQAVAAGTQQLSAGQESLAVGVGSAADGASSLAEGTATLADGLGDLSDGLSALAGQEGLPAAKTGAEQLSTAVGKIADALGTPGAPPATLPPTGDVTLLQLANGISVASVALAATAREVQSALDGLQPDLTSAASSAAAAAAQARGVYVAACTGTPTLTPEQCTALDEAASASAGVAVDVGSAAATVGVQADVQKGLVRGLGVMAYAMSGLTSGLEKLALALRSGDSSDPGVQEGLDALVEGLTESVVAVTALSDGASAAESGAQSINDGAQDLSGGLGEASAGANALATSSQTLASGAAQLSTGTQQIASGITALTDSLDTASSGSAQVAAGAQQLEEKGTSGALSAAVKASKEPAFARAYLAATMKRASDAAPYAAPKGGTARVAYVSYIDAGAGGDSQGARLAALWALVAAVLLALVVLAVLRIKAAGA